MILNCKEVLTWNSLSTEQKELIRDTLGLDVTKVVSTTKAGEADLRVSLCFAIFGSSIRLSESLQYSIVEKLFPTILKPTKLYKLVFTTEVRLTDSEYDNNVNNSHGAFTLEEIA